MFASLTCFFYLPLLFWFELQTHATDLEPVCQATCQQNLHAAQIHQTFTNPEHTEVRRSEVRRSPLCGKKFNKIITLALIGHIMCNFEWPWTRYPSSQSFCLPNALARWINLQGEICLKPKAKRVVPLKAARQNPISVTTK